jgi:MFS family permease
VSVLTNAYPAARAGHAIGLAYGIAGLGNAAGPLIGGLLTKTVGWRWIFWLNLPLTLVSLTICAFSITESSDETVPRRIDIAGLALITLAGVGVAVSGTVLEMLERTGSSTGVAIDLILAVLAALLLPAGLVVLLVARSRA